MTAGSVVDTRNSTVQDTLSRDVVAKGTGARLPVRYISAGGTLTESHGNTVGGGCSSGNSLLYNGVVCIDSRRVQRKYSKSVSNNNGTITKSRSRGNTKLRTTVDTRNKLARSRPVRTARPRCGRTHCSRRCTRGPLSVPIEAIIDTAFCSRPNTTLS